MALPFLLVGDHPALPSGLGRILRDLAQRLADDPALGLDVRIVGCRPGGTGHDGCGSIPVWSFLQSHDQASEIRDQVHLAWRTWWGETPGVVLSIWDAQRIAVLVAQPGCWEHWAYVPIDAAMVGGGLRGATANTMAAVDRLLAYGGYGHDVLEGVRPRCPYLPHGLDVSWWDDAGVERGQHVVGCVMTNQPRKDWGVALATVAELRKRGHKVKLWAHVDQTHWPWDLAQLIELYGLRKVVQITHAPLSDAQMQAAYQQCSVTMLPSLGEGFGYPLVESLASGVPCVHTTFGGGAELVPRPEWKVPERGRRVEGNGIERPVLSAEDFANAIERVWEWQAGWADRGAGYCRGSVLHLQWRSLYMRWRSWVKQGLDQR
jgi:glycosyltransferase involved in cell wall biosynthesis